MIHTGVIKLSNQCELHYYGIYGGPQGLKEIFSEVNLQPGLQFHVIDPLTKLQQIPYDQLKSCDPAKTLVVISTGESHGYPEYHQIIDKLTDYCGIDPMHIVMYTGCMEDTGPNYNIGTIVPHVANTFATPQLKSYKKYSRFHKSTPTHHFVCLNRAPAWQRATLVELLLDHGLDQYGAISYGTLLSEFELANLGKYPYDHLMFPLKYKNRLPLVVDKPTVTIADGFSVSNPKISCAFFNVITETSYESHCEITQEHYGVQNATLTEKSYKCFLLGQVPIWLSSYRTVHWAREFGFDVFDDIINHDYDTELDPTRRIHMVVNEIQRVCDTYTVPDLVNLEKKLKPRLKKNYQVLKSWSQGHVADVPRWLTYFNKVGLINDG